MEQNATQTVNLFVRSLSPRNRRDYLKDIVQRLDMLEATGAIDSYAVDVWGRQLVASDADWTTTGQRISDRLEEFRRWADRNNMSLDTFFPIETVKSEITNDEYTRIRFPVVTLAEYNDDEISFVSPCADGERTFTVVDRLDTLESTVEEVTGEPRQQLEANGE